MDVHAHTHTARKKWTHYFWEFLMLFFAVFCGFLAEYQLEHKIERDRAKEYASLLLEDLKHDSAYVERLLIQEHFKVGQGDSLLNILNSTDISGNNYKLVYHFNHVGTIIDFKTAFPVNFDQMKNSGSLRYIRNKKLTGQLSSLNRQLELTAEVYTGQTQFILQELKSFSIQHLNTQQFDIFSRKVLVEDPDIFDWNNKEARILANKVNLARTYDLFFVNHFLKNCKEAISETKKLIQTEYHLK